MLGKKVVPRLSEHCRQSQGEVRAVTKFTKPGDRLLPEPCRTEATSALHVKRSFFPWALLLSQLIVSRRDHEINVEGRPKWTLLFWERAEVCVVQSLKPQQIDPRGCGRWLQGMVKEGLFQNSNPSQRVQEQGGVMKS